MATVIPDFDERGYLPPGIHRASLDEIEARFGSSTEVRQVQMESLRWLLQLVSRVSIERIVLNGSWVTEVPEPIDIDCVMLAGSSWGTQAELEGELEDGVPFIVPHVVAPKVFDRYVGVIFASDRAEEPKGMIEVIRDEHPE